MAFNFKDAKPATGGGAFLRPGYHKLKAISATAGEYDGSNEFVEVEFENEDEIKFKERFNTTTKDGDAKKQANLLGRLQHLYEGITGKLLDKSFKSTEEIAEYFNGIFQSKKNVPRIILVGGEDDNGKIWARLPWGGFIVPKENEGDVEIGEFDEGGKEWKANVRKSGKTTQASGKAGGLLNNDDDDDLPFEDDAPDEKPKKETVKTGSKTTKKEEPKKTGSKVTKKEKEEDPAEEEDDW